MFKTSVCLIYIVGLSLAAVSAQAKTNDKAKSNSLDSLKLVPGDEKGNELKSLETELLVSATEQKALLQLQKLLKKYHGTSLEPELYFRLAELYMRKSKTDRFFEINRQSETVVHFAAERVKEAKSRGAVQK